MTDKSDGRLRDRPGVLSRAESFLERARNLMVSIVIVTAFLVVAVSLTINGWGGRYSIEPISAPDDFQKSVESGVGIAALLRDDLNKLVQISGTNVAIKPIGDEKAPEVTVMGATISIDYFIAAVRRLVGKEYPKITGEISFVDKNSTLAEPPMLCPQLARSKAPVRLVLRVGDDGGVPFFEGEGSFLDVARCGALYILKIVDPYSAASFLGQNPSTEMQAFKLLEEVAAVSPLSDMAEIDLIRGNIKLGSGKKSEAERLFNQASADYSDRHRGRAGLLGWYPAFDGLTTVALQEDGWYPAFDGLATTHLLAKRYDEALASVERSLELQRDYKSAMFHKAQIFDFQFRDEINYDKSSQCKIFNHVDMASNYYRDVIQKYPDMAVAYFNRGLMFLLLDTYWHFHPTADCKRGDPGYSLGAELNAKHLSNFDLEAEANFREATMLDPKNPDAWLQLGILLMQRQEWGMWEKPEPLAENFRRETLEEAIKCLTMAHSLKPGDSFIETRLDQANLKKQTNGAVEYFVNFGKLSEDRVNIWNRRKNAEPEQEALQ